MLIIDAVDRLAEHAPDILKALQVLPTEPFVGTNAMHKLWSLHSCTLNRLKKLFIEIRDSALACRTTARTGLSR